MAENEGVWRSIRHRDDIQVRLADLPEEVGGGVLVRRGGLVWILLDADRPAHERRAILAHELEHLRRGSCRFDGAPDTWADVVAREEQLVDRAVARRLVPIEALRAFVAQRSSLGEPVTAGCVAEAFEVPVWVARMACELAA
jgi:hypothetical protein